MKARRAGWNSNPERQVWRLMCCPITPPALTTQLPCPRCGSLHQVREACGTPAWHRHAPVFLLKRYALPALGLPGRERPCPSAGPSNRIDCIVLGEGFEPSRPCGHQRLGLARLPVPPPERKVWKARFELAFSCAQGRRVSTTLLPDECGQRDSNSQKTGLEPVASANCAMPAYC